MTGGDRDPDSITRKSDGTESEKSLRRKNGKDTVEGDGDGSNEGGDVSDPRNTVKVLRREKGRRSREGR